MKGTVEDWATESLLAARQAYQVPETGTRLKPGQKLGDAYLNANLSVVRQRLYRGADGWRWCALTRFMKSEPGLMPANLQIETSLRWSRSADRKSTRLNSSH